MNIKEKLFPVANFPSIISFLKSPFLLFMGRGWGPTLEKLKIKFEFWKIQIIPTAPEALDFQYIASVSHLSLLQGASLSLPKAMQMQMIPASASE